MFRVLPGAYLGWGLGSNDAANIFGPPVTSGLINYRRAVVLASIFILLGAILEGRKCFPTVSGVTVLTLKSAFIATLAAGIIVNLMSWLGFPVSTSQAIIGSIVGIGLLNRMSIDLHKLTEIIICWLLTPLGAVFISYLLFIFLRYFYQRKIENLGLFNSVAKVSCVLISCYAAYNLGANNVANTTGTFVAAGLLSPFLATFIGGTSISLGVLTYSKNVIFTVGKKIAPLDPFSGLIALLSTAVTLHLFTQLGVPVSSSQAMVGAVAGVGLARGARTVNKITLFLIFISWILTLLLSLGLAYTLGFLFK
ncbi:MAG: anion permease [Candidatus Omnitrophica bacterium]|nr:anion permease [Candidatus Omnitrophota bacterium]